MFWETVIEGKYISLRSVEESDAEITLGWRTNAEISKYFIGKVENDIEKQIIWIRNQRLKEGDYFFLILKNDSKLPVGTIGLYNINQETLEGEFGRWICLNPLFSLESVLLIHNFAFDVLKLQRVYSRTLKENVRVVNFHKRFGASLVNDNLILNKDDPVLVEYEIRKENYDQILKKNYDILLKMKIHDL